MKPSLLLIAVALVLESAFSQSLRPLRDGTELFVDDEQIAHQQGVTRRVHPARKHDVPVLEADNPRRPGGPRIYGTVHYDANSGKFRMWYSRLYATSDDGINWTKPEFDIVTSKGRPTNIILPKGGGAVIIDEIEPDPAKRYKVLTGEPIAKGGFSGYYSADGIHWTEYENNPIIPVGSEIAHVMRDPATRKYFAYIRPYIPRHHPKNVREKRLGAVVTSDDFVHWSDMEVVLTPDEIDDAWVKNSEQRTEFYAMNGFAYGRSYLGIIPIFYITEIHNRDDLANDQSAYEGPMEGQLITSRDGLKWDRMKERNPIIPPGQDWDVSIMNVAIAPVVVGDEVWHYYTGINTTHGGAFPPKRTSIGLAKWRLDGFVSLDGGDVEGVIETKPISGRTGALEINADAAGGQLTVEVLDETGNRVLEGYSAADGVPLTTDAVRHLVTWKNHDSLPKDRPFRLRFRLKNASLFSYTIKPS